MLAATTAWAAEPRLPAPQISQLVLGMRLDVLVKNGAWLNIRSEDGYIGWVHEGYVLTGDADWARTVEMMLKYPEIGCVISFSGIVHEEFETCWLGYRIDKARWQANASYQIRLIGQTSISPSVALSQEIQRDSLTAGSYLAGPQFVRRLAQRLIRMPRDVASPVARSASSRSRIACGKARRPVADSDSPG